MMTALYTAYLSPVSCLVNHDVAWFKLLFVQSTSTSLVRCVKNSSSEIAVTGRANVFLHEPWCILLDDAFQMGLQP